jgi:membrane-associated phospholipid phosphatase
VSRRPLVLLGLAAASTVAAVAVWCAAFAVPRGRALDGRALETFARAAAAPPMPGIHGTASLADPLPFALGAAFVIAIALVRRRPLMAAVVAAILLSANVTTQLLKPGLHDVVELRGGGTSYPGSWPSGHATASMSLALCLVLVAGPRLRPLAALVGAGYAIAVGYALVALAFHLPSDVLGGYLVAATFTLLGAAALGRLERRRPAPAPAARPGAPLSARGLALSSVAAVALAGAALAAREPGASTMLVEQPAAVLAAGGIGLLGLALTTGLARVLRA